jgi:type II secretory pathway predicted ATPase ExeA
VSRHEPLKPFISALCGYPPTLYQLFSSPYASIKAPGEIFTQAAIGVIHEYCGGIPRKINKVATACLMAAPGQKQ